MSTVEPNVRGKFRTWLDNHFMDTFQIKWMGKSLWKSIYFALAFSVIMVGAATIFTQSISDVDLIDKSLRLPLLISFMFDNLTTYFITSLAFAIGLSVNTWDATLLPFRKNMKQYINRACVSIFFALFLVFVLLQVGGLFGDEIAKNAHSSMSWLNMIIAGMFGLSQSWRSFYVYAVLNKSKRREFFKKRKDDGPVRSVFRFFIPFMDKTQLPGSLLLAIIVVLSSLSFSTIGSRIFVDEGEATPVAAIAIIFTVTLSFLSALLGVIIRLWNSLKPYGQKDTLYPYWERKQGFVKINPDLDDN